MVYRLGWVAGSAAIGLALLRLDRLLKPSAEGVPWQFILLAAAVLGAAITWAGTAYRLDGRLVGAINLAAVAITAVRVAVPSTTWLIFPTLSSFGELRYEIEFAREVIRAGIAPVIPLAGLIAILVLVFWGLGALLSWGLLTGRPYLAVLAPLAVYLQFATMDRSPASWWMWLFLLFLGAALLAVAVDRRRDGTGTLTSPVTRLAVPRSLPAAAFTALAAALVVAIGATTAVAGLVPRTGVLEWRVRSGLTGEYYGGVAYNPFVGIQAGLVSQTDAPVFVASIEGSVPGHRVAWRLITLESFNGIQWYTDAPELADPEETTVFEDPGQAFRGPTRQLTQEITILALEMAWLPAAYSPVAVSADNRTVERGVRVKDDGSLRFDAISYRGMTYRVVSQVPDPDLDVLSRGADGALSPVFRGAADDAAYADVAAGPLPAAVELADAERYLDLPPGIDAGVRALAREQVEGLETDFEKGLALESFFRTPGRFAYSVSIAPGHGAEDLSDWLIDPDSPSYRTGYCEQFAAAMAVMARQVGIPSRVVLGFTPGSVLDDGRVVVRDRNAHAWVELWMPTQGWVAFDPTPRGDRANPATIDSLDFDVSAYLDLGSREEAPPGSVPQSPGVFPSPTPTTQQIFVGGGGDPEGDGPGRPVVPGWAWWALAGTAVAAGLVPGLKSLRRRHRMRRLAAGDVTAAWRDLVDHLDDLGLPAAATDTPMEVAAAVSPMMSPLAEVYGSAVYGAAGGQPAGAVDTARRSLLATREALELRLGRLRRITAAYRVRSMLPAALRRRRRS